MGYVVLCIGCLECGIETYMVGTCATRQNAESLMLRLPKTGSDQKYVIFEVPPAGTVLPYRTDNGSGYEPA